MLKNFEPFPPPLPYPLIWGVYCFFFIFTVLSPVPFFYFLSFDSDLIVVLWEKKFLPRFLRSRPLAMGMSLRLRS